MKYSKIVIEPPGPNAARIIGIMKKNCYDSTFTYPLVIADGRGCVLRDVDGNSFLDFTSNIGSSPLGYFHPEIMEVLAEYSKNGAHKIAGQDFYCKEHTELSQELLSIVPQGFKTFFINSGAEAVENAMKVAYRKMSGGMTPSTLPGVSCVNAFHGRTLGALSFTFSKPVQKTGYPELPVLRIKFCTSDSDPEIDAVEKLLKESKVAFILSEVIQGEGGYNVASRQFVKNLRRCADRYGVPLILDEVQSGMGRTGRWWAFEHYDIRPDIMTVAKALQVGATAYEARLDPGQQGALSSTWGGGSRIDMAVGTRIIDIIKKDRLLQNAATMGEKLKKGLTELAGSGKGGIVDTRGIGLMIGIEFDTKVNRDAKLAQLFKKGLLLLPAGQKSMRAIPPLIITEQEVEEGLELIRSVL